MDSEAEKQKSLSVYKHKQMKHMHTNAVSRQVVDDTETPIQITFKATYKSVRDQCQSVTNMHTVKAENSSQAQREHISKQKVFSSL